jgi:hypothetical protein
MGRCTRAYIGVREESGTIKIRIRDKIRIYLKNEIQRLEFVSDKVEPGDNKREVMCMRFDCSPKKNDLVGALHRRAAMAGLRALWPAMESSPEREEMRREKSRGQGGGQGWGGC